MADLQKWVVFSVGVPHDCRPGCSAVPQQPQIRPPELRQVAFRICFPFQCLPFWEYQTRSFELNRQTVLREPCQRLCQYLNSGSRGYRAVNMRRGICAQKIGEHIHHVPRSLQHIAHQLLDESTSLKTYEWSHDLCVEEV